MGRDGRISIRLKSGAFHRAMRRDGGKALGHDSAGTSYSEGLAAGEDGVGRVAGLGEP
jgi:hypothetical protein